MFLGVSWLWLQVEIANYVQWLKVRSLARSAKSTLQEAMANPDTSAKHKAVINGNVIVH